jgi:putative porin
MLKRQDIREESHRGKALRGAVVVLAAIALCLTGSRAWAALEDILYESGKITKEEWLKVKADKEKEEAEREKQAKDAMRGVVTHDQKKAKWVDSVTWSGDLRLRHEQFWRYANGVATTGADRSRQRFRLRFGPEVKMGGFKATVQVGTSTSTDGINGDQVSHNQSFDNAFSQKEIFILRAYADWNPSFFKPMTIMAGKLKNPFYTQYTNDVLFDADVNPEGFAEAFTFKVTDSISLFTNFGQFVLDEDGAGGNDQFMLAFQGGTELKFLNSKLRLTVGLFDALNLAASGLSEPTTQQFNSKAGAAGNAQPYVNDYDVLHLAGSFDTEIIGFPVNVLGDFVKNTTGVISCPNNPGNLPGLCVGTRIEDQDKGYQVGVRIGKASKANTWEVAYYYKWLQADAALSAFVDSDFGDGGTNRRGNIFWVGYNVTDFLNLKVKFFNTKPLEKSLCGTNTSCLDDIDRMQIDAVFTF